MSAEAERKRQKELAEQRGQLKPMSWQFVVLCASQYMYVVWVMQYLAI